MAEGDGNTHSSVSGGQQENVVQAGTINHLQVGGHAPPAAPSDEWLLVGQLFGLFLAVMHWPGGPIRQYAVFALLCTAALGASVGSLVFVRLDKATQHRLTLRNILLIMSFLFSFGGMIEFHSFPTGDSRPVGVSMENMVMKGAHPAPATIHMPTPGPANERRNLRLDMAVEDSNQRRATCIPDVTVLVTVSTAGKILKRKLLPAEGSVPFVLAEREEQVDITFSLTAKEHCEMRLAKASLKLTN